MRGAASTAPLGEAVLTGRSGDFPRLAELVDAGDSSLGLVSAPSAPYELALRTVVVRRTGALLASIHLDRPNRALVVEGPADKLAVLAHNIRAMADAEPPDHLHVEWYPDHPYLADGSLSLVLEVVAESLA